MTDQLPLPFVATPDYLRLEFVAHGGVADALAWLGRADWPGLRLALWGDGGTGKTHLLHRWNHTVVSGAALHWPAPPGPLAIDDADQAPAEVLLHGLNAAAEAGWPVLLAARTPPARWRIALPDLHSRLAATVAVELRRGDDAFRAQLLQRLLADRQLTASPHLQSWLLTHLPRDPAALREAVSRLDAAALAAQHAPTRPMAAEALATLLDDNSMPELPSLSHPHLHPG